MGFRILMMLWSSQEWLEAIVKLLKNSKPGEVSSYFPYSISYRVRTLMMITFLLVQKLFLSGFLPEEVSDRVTRS